MLLFTVSSAVNAVVNRIDKIFSFSDVSSIGLSLNLALGFSSSFGIPDLRTIRINHQHIQCMRLAVPGTTLSDILQALNFDYRPIARCSGRSRSQYLISFSFRLRSLIHFSVSTLDVPSQKLLFGTVSSGCGCWSNS